MAMFIFIIAVISLSNAQDYFEGDKNSYGNTSNCIGKYLDLEKYVLNNEDLIGNLTEVYFKTGKTPAEFVKIIYKFKVLHPATNSTNDTISYVDSVDGEFTCVDEQKVFIWSSSALYLLGPKPLFWLTFLAVNVQEFDITIDLPCLCRDAYDDLLSRLTYLIKIYPAMQLQGGRIEFISFETKAENNNNYRTIVGILSASSLLPWATCFVFSYLAYFYTEWIARRAKQYIKHGASETEISESTEDNHDNEDQEKKKRNRRIKIAALILASVFLCITLFIFHIVASVRLIQYYGHEVLHDTADSHMSTVITALSFVPTSALVFIALYKSCQIVSRLRKEHVDEVLGNYLQLSLGILFIYLGFYFSPYVVLAFIDDPIVTGFVYLIGGPLIFVVYLASYTVCLMVNFFLTRKFCSINYSNTFSYMKSNFGDILLIMFTYASGISIAYFVFILIYILALGSFHDFQAVQNLTLPIIIGLLSFFVFKPILESIKKSIEGDDPTATAQNSNANNAYGNIINTVEDQ